MIDQNAHRWQHAAPRREEQMHLRFAAMIIGQEPAQATIGEGVETDGLGQQGDTQALERGLTQHGEIVCDDARLVPDGERLVVAVEEDPFVLGGSLSIGNRRLAGKIGNIDEGRARVEEGGTCDRHYSDRTEPSEDELGLARREALWAIKALRDEPLPLFAAASDREERMVPEVFEPAMALRPMTAGSEVVEDYGHVGLSLRGHPLSFLRADLRRRLMVTCAEAMEASNGRWLEAAGIVLVRQRPGSAKGVMFITLEDETSAANLVVWPKVFEADRRTVLSARMMAVRGRIQREGEIVHLVAHRITDLSCELACLGQRDAEFPLPHGRGDEARSGGGAGLDRRTLPSRMPPPHDMYVRDLHIDGIKVKTRDFS